MNDFSHYTLFTHSTTILNDLKIFIIIRLHFETFHKNLTHFVVLAHIQ